MSRYNHFLLSSIRALVHPIDSNVRHVNRGGCGAAALAIYRVLQPVIPCDLVIFGSLHDSERTLSDISMLIEMGEISSLWEMSELNLHHVMVEFYIGDRAYYVDSTGVHRRTEAVALNSGYEPIPGYLSFDALKKIVDNPKGWNDTFKRRDINVIEQLCDRSLFDFMSLPIYG